jgi:hypothetical protein
LYSKNGQKGGNKTSMEKTKGKIRKLLLFNNSILYFTCCLIGCRIQLESTTEEMKSEADNAQM